MKEKTIVQFVAFETTLDSAAFFTQWEQYKQSMDTDWNATLQQECASEMKPDESKILVFIVDPTTDLDSFRHFSVHGKLNIYEAYYENCQFTYILEFFVKDEYAFDVLQQLKILTSFL